jgi:small-conductance mechanosensitive channel
MTIGSRRSLIGPAVLIGAGAVLSVAGPLLRLPPDAAGILRHLSGIWLWLSLAWLVTRALDAFLRRLARVSRDGLPYPRLLMDLLRVAVFAAAAMAILLLVFDQPATGVITLSSVTIAIIGFALRNVFNDLFSGIVLGVEHPYRIGDWVETVQGICGRVAEITWRTTRLIDRNGFLVVVPNGLVASQRLINYSSGNRDFHAAIRVPLDAATAVVRAKRILLSGALDAGRRIPGLAPDVLLSEYADGMAVFAVRFRVADFGHEATTRDAVASCVAHAMHCAGLALPRTHSSGPVPPDPPSPRRVLLRQVDLFRAFDEDERDSLAAKLRPREVLAGQVVVRQGDPGDSLYLLGEGILDVEVARPDGEPVRNRIAPGEVFGEISLLTGQPRTATVTAMLDSVIYEIQRTDLDPLIKQRPEIAEGLATIMAEHRARERELGTPPPPVAPIRDDILARLRLLFGL